MKIRRSDLNNGIDSFYSGPVYLLFKSIVENSESMAIEQLENTNTNYDGVCYYRGVLQTARAFNQVLELISKVAVQDSPIEKLDGLGNVELIGDDDD